MYAKPMSKTAFTPVLSDTPLDHIDELQRIEEALHEDTDELTQAMDFIALYEMRKQELGLGSILNVHKQVSQKSKPPKSQSHADRKKIKGKCQRLPGKTEKPYPANPEMGQRMPEWNSNPREFGQGSHKNMLQSQSSYQLPNFTDTFNARERELKPCISVNSFIKCEAGEEFPMNPGRMDHLPSQSKINLPQMKNWRDIPPPSQQFFGSLAFQSTNRMRGDQGFSKQDIKASSIINPIYIQPIKAPIPIFGQSSQFNMNQSFNPNSQQFGFDLPFTSVNMQRRSPPNSSDILKSVRMDLPLNSRSNISKPVQPFLKPPSQFNFQERKQVSKKSSSFYTPSRIEIPRNSRRLYHECQEEDEDYHSLYESPSRPFKTPPSRDISPTSTSQKKFSNRREVPEIRPIQPKLPERRVQPTLVTINQEFQVKRASRSPVSRQNVRTSGKEEPRLSRRPNPDTDDTLQRHSTHREQREHREQMHQQQEPNQSDEEKYIRQSYSQVSVPKVHMQMAEPQAKKSIHPQNTSVGTSKVKAGPKPTPGFSPNPNNYKPTPKPATPKQEHQPSKPIVTTPDQKRPSEKQQRSISGQQGSARHTKEYGYTHTAKGSEETRQYFNRNFKVKVGDIILNNTVSKISIDLSEHPIEANEEAMYQSGGEEFDLELDKSLEELSYPSPSKKRPVDHSYDYDHSGEYSP